MHDEDDTDNEEKYEEMDGTTSHPANNIVAAMKDFKVPKVDNFPVNQKRQTRRLWLTLLSPLP